jgi:hypothetical protein
MSHLTLATYALRRQKLAVERVMGASSVEESELAARWAQAWHQLVQAQLDLADSMAGLISHPHRRRYPRPANRVLH